MNKHTATPWAWRGHADLNGLCHINAENKTIVQVWDFPEAEANAAFICRACNSHEALVEALKQSTALLEDIAFEMSNEAMQVAKYLCLPEIERNHTALKLAEGRE